MLIPPEFSCSSGTAHHFGFMRIRSGTQRLRLMPGQVARRGVRHCGPHPARPGERADPPSSAGRRSTASPQRRVTHPHEHRGDHRRGSAAPAPSDHRPRRLEAATPTRRSSRYSSLRQAAARSASTDRPHHTGQPPRTRTGQRLLDHAPGQKAIGRLPGRARAGTIRAAAFTVRRLPGPDQLAPGTQDPVAGLRDRERGELVTALQTAQVTGVIPRQAAERGQGKPALVPAARSSEPQRWTADRSGVRTRRFRPIGLSHDICSWLASSRRGRSAKAPRSHLICTRCSRGDTERAYGSLTDAGPDPDQTPAPGRERGRAGRRALPRARPPVPAGPGLGRREAIRPGCGACSPAGPGARAFATGLVFPFVLAAASSAAMIAVGAATRNSRIPFGP